MRLVRGALFVLPAALLLVVAGLALSDSAATVQKAEKGKPGIEPPAGKLAAVGVHLGKEESAKWTATTIEAASGELNKKVLESGKVKTVTGEVVDVSCFLQLGKRGEAHIPCGSKCIRNGEPIGLVDPDGELYILFAEEHHPRRDGQVDLKKVFLPLLAKDVTVTGMETEMKGVHALFIQGAEIGASVSVKPAEVPTSKK